MAVTQRLSSVSVWASYVIECRREDGSFDESQVIALLKAHRPKAKRGLQKIQRLQDIGWPEARTKLLIEHGRRAIVKPDDEEPTVWELKTNPHPWRFYFHIDEPEHHIIYAYSIYKTTTAADPRDVASARRFLARLAQRTARRVKIDFDE